MTATPIQLDAAISAALVHLDNSHPFEARASLMRAHAYLAELHPEINLGEAQECGQCEGSGTTDAMGKSEECPVCDGTGRLK